MAVQHDFWDRVIDWATLDTPTKRVIAFGLALLSGLALLTALRGVFIGPDIAVVIYVVPLAALVIAGVATGVAVTLMLAGASAARSRWRFLGVIGLAGLCLSLMPLMSRTEVERTSAEIAWLAVYLLAVGGTALIAFGHRLAWHRTLALAAAIIGGVAAIVVIATLWAGTNHGGEVVVKVMIVAVVAALPAIIVVGWDLAEIAGETSAVALRRLSGLVKSQAALAALAIALAIAAATWLERAHHLDAAHIFFRAAFLGLLALLFVWALPRLQKASAAHGHGVGYFHVLFVAVLIAVTMWAGVALTRDADNAFNAHTGHTFSVELPPAWKVVRDPVAGLPLIAETRSRHTIVHLAPKGQAGIPRLNISVFPVRPVTRVPRASIKIPVSPIETVEVPLSPRKIDKQSHAATAQFTDSRGRRYAIGYLHKVYDQHGPLDAVYVFICVFRLPDTTHIEKACDDIVGSFEFDPRTEPSQEERLFFNETIWVALALTCLILLATRSAAPGSSVEFLMWVAIVVIARNVATNWGHYHHEIAQDVGLNAEILAGALWLGAIAVFVTTVEVARNPARAAVGAHAAALSFLVALVVAVIFFELYVQAAEASGQSHAIRGAIIVAALGWEFWTSGSMITNRNSTHYPRPARIMFYLGYLLVVATIVFFWVQIVRAAGRDQAAFEPELYVATGLVCLGLPFLLFRHMRTYLDVAAGDEVTSPPAISPSDP